MSAPILPGSVLGVLGGGQLARMFTLAARRMGYRVNVFAPEDDTPAGQIAYHEIRAEYDDFDAIERFAKEVAVVTFEFENVPAATAEAALRHAPVRPAGSLLHATQERTREKTALARHGLPLAPWAKIASASDLAPAAEITGFPAILKTAAWGYDGKGQRSVHGASELREAWRELGESLCVLERRIPFAAELSVVGARALDGAIALYEPTLNHHRDHVLDVSLCPAPVSAKVQDEAMELTRSVLETFDTVGVLCVEFFLLDDDTLLVNEVAPRPHNSGHVTLDAHVTSQFELQVRAVCALPLGSTERTTPAAAMANLLGDLWLPGPPNWPAALRDDAVRLHLYGKATPRKGRKMGHLTVASRTLDDAERRALKARAALVGLEHG